MFIRICSTSEVWFTCKMSQKQMLCSHHSLLLPWNSNCKLLLFLYICGSAGHSLTEPHHLGLNWAQWGGLDFGGLTSPLVLNLRMTDLIRGCTYRQILLNSTGIILECLHGIYINTVINFQLGDNHWINKVREKRWIVTELCGCMWTSNHILCYYTGSTHLSWLRIQPAAGQRWGLRCPQTEPVPGWRE